MPRTTAALKIGANNALRCRRLRRGTHGNRPPGVSYDAPHRDETMDLSLEPLAGDGNAGLAQSLGVSLALVAQGVEAGGEHESRRQSLRLFASSGEARQSVFSPGSRR